MSDHDSGVDSDDEASQHLLEDDQVVVIIPEQDILVEEIIVDSNNNNNNNHHHSNSIDDDDDEDQETRPEWAQARRGPFSNLHYDQDDDDDDDDEDETPREFRPINHKVLSSSLPVELEMGPTTSTAPYPTGTTLQMRTVSISEMDEDNNTTSSSSDDDVAIRRGGSSQSTVNLLGHQFDLNKSQLNALWNFYQHTTSADSSVPSSTTSSSTSTISSTTTNNNFEQHDFIGKIKTAKRRRHKSVKMDFKPYNDFLAEKHLRIASGGNDIQTVRRLLTSGTSANTSDERRRTPLHLAACHGYCDIALALLEHGADPNLQDVVGNTPLHLAVCASKLDMVIVLLQAGASCTSSDNSGRTPLRLARSKLSLIARSIHSASSDSESVQQFEHFKLEAIKISLMMSIYFEKCKRDQGQHEIETRMIGERLQRSHTKGEVERDVNDLLTRLQHWSL